MRRGRQNVSIHSLKNKMEADIEIQKIFDLDMRAFFLSYQNCQTLSGNFGHTIANYYLYLTRIKDVFMRRRQSILTGLSEN